ncbi:MAG TPA: S8 family serine peptidase, partial [Fimbriimonas sp.]
MDEHGHGTHVAGTIAATYNNGLGVVGVAPSTKIIPCRFLGDGGGATSSAIYCVDFARTRGAKIMSNSWGGGGYSQLLIEAIQRARDAGILFVAAAGNYGINIDDFSFFPASYNAVVDNVVSVGATNWYDQMAGFSNFGRSVDVAAPGENILNTYPG